MQTTWTQYNVDGTEVEGSADLPAEPYFMQIKDAACGPIFAAGAQHVEHVTVLFRGERSDMFVDEQGIERGLPVNEKATAIYRAAWLSHSPDTPPETLPSIYGLAIVFHRRVWF